MNENKGPDMSFLFEQRTYRDPEALGDDHREIYDLLEQARVLAKAQGIEPLETHITVCQWMLRSHDTPRIRATHVPNNTSKN